MTQAYSPLTKRLIEAGLKPREPAPPIWHCPACGTAVTSTYGKKRHRQICEDAA